MACQCNVTFQKWWFKEKVEQRKKTLCSYNGCLCNRKGKYSTGPNLLMASTHATHFTLSTFITAYLHHPFNLISLMANVLVSFFYA